MNVYQRLNAARDAFHQIQLKKSGENKFAGYKYFELGDFLIPGLKVFRDVGLFAGVSFTSDMAVMVVRNVEKPEESVTFTSPMGSANLKGCHEVQNIGAVETYQRRYLWVAALEIVEHDAVDSAPPATEEATTKKPDRTLTMKVMRAIREHVANDRELGALQEWEGACAKSEEFAADVWAGLTTPERETLRAAKQAKNATREPA